MSAPIPHLADVETTTYTTGSTLVIDKPAGVSDRDLLVMAFYARNSGATITAPSGWTAAQSENTSGTLAVYTKPVPVAASETATDYTWTVTGGSGRGAGVLFRVSDAHRTVPVDAVGAAVTLGTSSIVNPAASPTSAEALLVAVWVCNRGDSTQSSITPPGSMTAVAGVDVSTGAATSHLAVAVQTLSAAGSTGTRTATVSPAATSAAGFLVALAPIQTASAALVATSSLAAAAQQVHGASVALSAASALSGTSGGQQHQGAATLSATPTLTASAGYPALASLGVDGIWRPVTHYELVSGSWVDN